MLENDKCWKMQVRRICVQGKEEDMEMRKIINGHRSTKRERQNATGYLPWIEKRKTCYLRLPLPLPPFWYTTLLLKADADGL